MYVIETIVLDEVKLAVQTCSHWIQAASETLDFIKENPQEEQLGLDSFNETFAESGDSFLDSIDRLFDIAGVGEADALLWKEVRNNVLNIQNADQLSCYMEVVVTGMDISVQNIQESISELKIKAEPYFDSTPLEVFKKREELVDLFVSITRVEITNESEKIALLIVDRMHFLAFFESVENLLYVLALIGPLNPPTEILSTEEQEKSPIQKNTPSKTLYEEKPKVFLFGPMQARLFKTLSDYTPTEYHEELELLLTNGYSNNRIWIKMRADSLAYVFKQARESGSNPITADKTETAKWLATYLSFGKNAPKAVSEKTAYKVLRGNTIVEKSNQIRLKV